MHGRVELRVEPTRAAAVGCVVVGIPLDVDYWVLDALSCGVPPRVVAFPDRVDRTVVAYAAYEAAYGKLLGTTAKAIKSKVSAMRCGAQDNEFQISVTCEKTLFSVRKNASEVLAKMKFGTLYTRYEGLCRTIGVAPDADGYDHAAAEANRALQSRVLVVMVGRVGAKPDDVARAAQLLDESVKDVPPKTPGKPRRVDINGAGRVGEVYESLDAPGLEGVILRNFVESKLKDIRTDLTASRLYFPKNRIRGVHGLAGPAKRAQVDRFAQALLRLGDETLGALVFTAARGCLAPTESLKITGRVSARSAAAAIDRALA